MNREEIIFHAILHLVATVYHYCLFCNPANGRVDFVEGWHIFLYQDSAVHAVRVDSWPELNPLEEETQFVLFILKITLIS